MNDGILQDLRFGLRSFWQSPGFTAAAVAALALGIGANTAIFSVVDATLLNPLPFKQLREPERLVMLWERNPALNLFAGGRRPVRMKSFRVWQDQSRSFAGLALYNDATFNLTGQADTASRKPERVEAGVVSAGFLPLLGIRPQLGRDFKAGEPWPETGIAGCGDGHPGGAAGGAYRSGGCAAFRVMGG